MKKKIFFILIIFFICLTLIFFNRTVYNLLPFELRVVALSIFNNEKTSKKILNDLKTKFLPETQLISLNFKKIKLDELNFGNFEIAHGMYGETYKSFFIEKFNDKIFIISKSGILAYFDENEVNQNIVNFKNLETNLAKNNETILNFHISDEYIYVSIAKLFNETCEKLLLKKAKLNLSKVFFSDVVIFDECLLPSEVAGGALTSFKKNGKNKILISASDYELLNKNNKMNITRAQNKKSIFGKILIVDPETGEYKNYSRGHRVILGLYSNEQGDIVLAVENGPRGGDEINNIKIDNNYGWNISSYGEKYGTTEKSIPTLKKTHAEMNFVEPIFSYTPSVAPSSIIKLDNNFSDFWVDNFLMGTLVYGHLMRLKFNENFDRLILNEPIYIGERIRDILYLKDEKKILLALETSGSIAVLSLKK